MFGRRTTPIAFGPSNPPPPPPGDNWPPFDKMNSALDAAIRLFARALEQAGRDCEGLGTAGPPPPAVASLLADCVVYPGERGSEFLTLGLTRDFESFSYQPHCRLFLIINGAHLLEDVSEGSLRSEIALSQVPGPLIEAHMMKRWIKYIRPTGHAVAGGQMERLSEIMKSLLAETNDVARLAPRWISERVDIGQAGQEWCSGFPGAIGRPLTPEVKRINNLPMTEFVEKLITDFLVEMQMQGLREDRRRA